MRNPGGAGGGLAGEEPEGRAWRGAACEHEGAGGAIAHRAPQALGERDVKIATAAQSGAWLASRMRLHHGV